MATTRWETDDLEGLPEGDEYPNFEVPGEIIGDVPGEGVGEMAAHAAARDTAPGTTSMAEPPERPAPADPGYGFRPQD